MKSLIKKLVETTGPSGYENIIRDTVKKEIEPFVDEQRVDALGNLIARKGKKGKDGLKVMVAAHMDEIGVIATHIDENGFVRFTSIGGLFLAYAIAARVRFTNGALGVIGYERSETRDIPLEKMYIDVGAIDRASCPVRVGDVACFERPFMEIGDRLVCKAMDDRIGVAVMITTLQQIKSTPNEIYFTFSVQEEVGCRGATTAAYAIDPDIGFALDVTMTGDTPKGIKMDVSLGKGPAIKVRDGGMLSDPRVLRWMTKAAETEKIPYQLEILEGGTTDAKPMQISRAGMPTGCISIPCRYVHSQSEMVDLNDVQNAVRLIVNLLSHPIVLE